VLHVATSKTFARLIHTRVQSDVTKLKQTDMASSNALQ